jgi:amino acid adenylation domain-containing protein
MAGSRTVEDLQPTLASQFAEVVRTNPDRVAISSEAGSHTYAELDDWAEHIAQLLSARAIGPGDRIGLHLPASPLWIAAMLAVLKRGGAYVPLDPGTPIERRRYICGDAGLALVLGESLSGREGSGHSGGGRADGGLQLVPWITAEELAAVQTSAATRSHSQVPYAPSPADAAYVIYTSGTTGRPKGVPITHDKVLALFRAVADHLAFRESDVWLLFHSVAFDFSVWEIWGAILYGGRVHIPEPLDSRQPHRCADLIRRQRVTVLNQTPSAYRTLQPALVQALVADGSTSLRYVVFGGEALDPLEVQASLDAFPQTRLVNMYGITETTVHATFYVVTGSTEESEPHSPIGHPLPGFSFAIVDEDDRQVAAGDVGELLLAGLQVSGGYLNRPELTQQRFALLDLDGSPRRYYRTGDLVRETQYGLRYVGRNDSQVQLRGHRVELGEIETVMRLLAGVETTIALVHTVDVGDDRLMCVYSTASHHAIATAVLREHARHFRPAYMQPSHFIWVPSIPRTANGKTDRTKAALVAKEYLNAQLSRLATR